MISVKGQTKEMCEIWIDPKEVYTELTFKAIVSISQETFWGARYVNLDYVSNEIVISYWEWQNREDKRLTAEDIGIGIYEQVSNLIVGRDEFLRIEKIHGE
jgi:hypothetical protein